jgi:hypothetical protein
MDFQKAIEQLRENTEELVEAGFEYVCDHNGSKIFRKRK